MPDFDPKTWDFYLAARELIEADRAADVGGPQLPLPHEPCQGVYRMRTHRDGPFIPVQIWYAGGALKCKRNGTMIEDVAARGLWSYCGRNAITQEQHDGYLATKRWWDEVAVEVGGKTMSSQTPEPKPAKPPREKLRPNPDEVEKVQGERERLLDLVSGEPATEAPALVSSLAAEADHLMRDAEGLGMQASIPTGLPEGYLILDGVLYDDMGDDVTDPDLLRAAGLLPAEEPATSRAAETPVAHDDPAEEVVAQPATLETASEINAVGDEARVDTVEPEIIDRFWIGTDGRFLTSEQDLSDGRGLFEISEAEFGKLLKLNKVALKQEVIARAEALAASRDVGAPQVSGADLAPAPVQSEPTADPVPQEREPPAVRSAGIGDNSGSDEFAQIRDDIAEWCRVGKIQAAQPVPETADQATPLADTFTKLGDFGAALKRIKADEKAPHQQHLDAIEARHKPLMRDIADVRDDIKARLDPYYKAAEAREKARAEEETKRRQEAAGDMPVKAVKPRSVGVGTRRTVAPVRQKEITIHDPVAAASHFASMKPLPPDIADVLRRLGKKSFQAGIAVPGLEYADAKETIR